MKKNKVVNNIGYISASRDALFSKCKFAFWDQVIVNGHDQYSEDYEDDSADAIYLLFGKAMHKTLELFHQNKMKKKSELIMTFRQQYIDYAVNDKSYYSLGMEMCETYWGYLKRESPRRILIGTEIFFRIYLGKDINGDDAYGQGTIDAVWYYGNGLYEIVDYKTSNWLPSSDELEANTQIELYDIAFRSEELSHLWYNGIEPKAIILTMNYLRFENGVLQTEIDDEERELNRLYFIDEYMQMNTLPKKKFTCNLNTLCYYCDSNVNCKAYQSLLTGDEDEIKELLNLEFTENDFADNIRLIDKYKAIIKSLEREMNDLSATNIDYIKHNDVDVIVDDKQYFLNNSSRRYLLPMITMKILKQNDLWEDKEFITNISVGKVESLCKEYPEVWEQIERKAIKISNGSATLKSKKIPKGILFDTKKTKKSK